MIGIILAAGRGSRMKGMTESMPKCLVPLEGRPLLDYQVAALRGAGVGDIVVIGGYRAEMLEGRGLRVLRNPDWESTNMVATLACAGDLLDRDFVISYGDIVYRPAHARALLEEPADIAVLVDRRWRDLWSLRFADPYQDAETLVLDGAGRILELGRKVADPARVHAQYTGLLRFSGAGRRAMAACLDEVRRGAVPGAKPFATMYMTDFIQLLIDRGLPVKAVAVDGGFLEVDSDADHALYRRLSAGGALGPFLDPSEFPAGGAAARPGEGAGW